MVAGYLDILPDDVDVLVVVAECAQLIFCALAELVTKIVRAVMWAVAFNDILATGPF